MMPGVADILDQLESEEKRSGMGALQALDAVEQEASPKQKEMEIGAGESFLIAALQSATAGFSDEMLGALEASGIEKKDIAAAAFMGPAGIVSLIAKAGYNIGRQGLDETLAKYSEKRDVERQRIEAAKEHSVAYGAGTVAGGVATAAIPGAAPTSIVRAVLGGAVYGAAAGLGESKKESVRDVLEDTLTGAAVGGVAGGVTQGIATGVGRAVRGLRGARATDVAAEQAKKTIAMAEEPSLVGDKSIREAIESGIEIQNRVSRELGVNFQLMPSQLTGRADLAVIERKAQQFPETMQRALAIERKQLRQAERYLENQANYIAKKPKLIGRRDVSTSMIEALEKAGQRLINERSAAAGPLYKAAAEASGNIRVIPVSDTVSELVKLSSPMQFGPKGLAEPLRSTLRRIGVATGKSPKSLRALKSGKLSIEKAQNLREFWSSVLGGEQDVFSGMSKRKQKYIARRILAAIDSDMSRAKGAGAKATDLLRKANATWSEHTRNIESLATNTIRKALKLGKTDAADTLVDKLSTMSENQVKGVFRVLDSEAPEVASAARAQMFEDLLTKAGKPVRGSEAAAEGIGQISPLTALRQMSKLEGKLRAAFGDDKQAADAFRNARQLLQRLAMGPGFKGSQTAPMQGQVFKDSVEELANRAILPATAAAGFRGAALATLARNVLRGLTGGGKGAAEAFSSREGIFAFQAVLMGAEMIAQGKPVSRPVAAAMARAADNLALFSGLDEEER